MQRFTQALEPQPLPSWLRTDRPRVAVLAGNGWLSRDLRNHVTATLVCNEPEDQSCLPWRVPPLPHP